MKLVKCSGVSCCVTFHCLAVIPVIDIDGSGSCSGCTSCPNSTSMCDRRCKLASSVGQCMKVLPFWLTPIMFTCSFLSEAISFILSMSALPDWDGLTRNEDLSFCMAPVFAQGFLCVDDCGTSGLIEVMSCLISCLRLPSVLASVVLFLICKRNYLILIVMLYIL